MPFEDLMKVYGFVPRAGEHPMDITGKQCVSFDLRAVTGAQGGQQGTLIEPPHPFTVALFAPTPQELPTAEILFHLYKRTVHLVGAPTGRQVLELTPQQLRDMSAHVEYRRRMLSWVEGWQAA